MQWRHWLRVKSRDERALWKMTAVVLVTGAAIGVAVDYAVPPRRGMPAVELPQLLPGPDPPTDPETPDTLPEIEPWNSIRQGWKQAEQAAEQGDWFGAWRCVWRLVLMEWRALGPAVLATMTALCWLAFAVQASQPDGWRDGRAICCLGALALGTAGTGLTLFCDLWQEYAWGLRESSETIGGLRYYVLGVGLREEISKVVCAAPFLPWFVRRRDGLGAMMAFGCGGLGFALQENIGYIAMSSGSGTLARLLTPAPLHMALTGLIGLAAYQACRWPGRCLPAALGTFVAAMLFHGIYDALLSVPAFSDYGFAAYTLFVLLMWHFFRELRALRSSREPTLSLTASFLLCVTLTAAATFIYLSATANWQFAADILFQSLMAETAMVYLFLREMPGSPIRAFRR